MNFDLMDPVPVIMGWLPRDRAGDNGLGLIPRRTEDPTSAPSNPMAGCEAVSMFSWDASGRDELTRTSSLREVHTYEV